MNTQADLFRPPFPEGVPLDVATLFEQLTLGLITRGMKHYSARAVFHRIRWEYQVEKGERDFAVNNNWSAAMARWFHAAHPAHAGFFETRERKEHQE